MVTPLLGGGAGGKKHLTVAWTAVPGGRRSAQARSAVWASFQHQDTEGTGRSWHSLLCICAPASRLTGPQRWELANHREEPRALGDRALSLAAHSGV